MFTENSKRRRRRGRPAGRTVAGEATRERLFEAAVALIGERGYEQATLRDVAQRAGVSAALLYRYFPSKRAVVLALYDELSKQFAERARQITAGRWRARFADALELSLEVLGPHRVTLRALAPVIVGDTSEGVLAQATAFSRRRVQGVFEGAVADASDAPRQPLALSLGRLLYLAHLAVVLWWLLDRSPHQRATRTLLGLVRQALPSAALTLRLPAVRRLVLRADALFVEALVGAEEQSAAANRLVIS